MFGTKNHTVLRVDGALIAERALDNRGQKIATDTHPHLPVRLADEDAQRLDAAAADVRRALDAYAGVLADAEAATGRIAALPAPQARALLGQVTSVLSAVRTIVTGGAS